LDTAIAKGPVRVSLDESGQEWANLMAPSSGPIITYGSTRLSDADAADLLDQLRPAWLSPRDKSKAWLKPDTVGSAVAVLNSAPAGSQVVGIAYRPWFAVAKIVSLAVDAAYYSSTGVGLETKVGPTGRPLGAWLTQSLWEELRVPGTAALPDDVSAALLHFQQFVLRGDRRAGTRFADWVAERSVESQVSLVRDAWLLALEWITAELGRHDSGLRRPRSSRDLAPSVPLLVEVLREWGRRAGNRGFEVIHHRSSEIEHHFSEILTLGQGAPERWAAVPGHISLPAFIPGSRTTFTGRSSGIALADLMAGALRLWITASLAPESLSDDDMTVAEQLDAVAWLPMVGENCYLGP
jgi:hypothetical protein